ncbi:MAG: hypothetical protein K8U57_30190 [Planctomycetes bacterium]|nr:hypothetical protein [Planctomycetota bacterium]
MSVRYLFALVAGFAFLTNPAFADDPVPAKKKPDPTAELLEKLAGPATLQKGDAIPLREFALYIQAKYAVSIVINVKAFKANAEADAEEFRLRVPDRKGLPLGVVLRQVLDQADATFLVRRAHIEIVPIAFAAQETKNATDETPNAQLKEPLVSVVFKEKAFNEAVAELAEENDLTVIVAPQSGDARMGFVTARMLNMPADKALELLAVQCDLRVIRKGNAYLITSRDHANEMFGERLEKEKQEIEVEKLREAPAKPPEPPKPEPKP